MMAGFGGLISWFHEINTMNNHPSHVLNIYEEEYYEYNNWNNTIIQWPVIDNIRTNIKGG